MRRRQAVLLLPAFFFTIQMCAQQLATLNVTVFDPTGGVVSKAQVTARNTDTDAKRGELTNGAGVATIPSLPAGNYELTIEADQFSPYKASLPLTVGQIASVNVTLAIKTAQETINVQENVNGADTQKSEVSQVIERDKIAELPISGRDFIDFVLLTPTANVGRSTAVARNLLSRKLFLS
jgi:hypothetical protein